MNTSKEAIGELIKRMREKKKFSRAQLAEKLDVDRQYIWRLENGKINVTPVYLDKVIKALESSPEEFFNMQEQEALTNVL